MKREVRVKRNLHTVEQMIRMLREAQVHLSPGKECRSSESGFRDFGTGLLPLEERVWRLKISQAKRFRELDRKNTRLKKAVAELTLDKVILKEALERNHGAPNGAASVEHASSVIAVAIYSPQWLCLFP